MNIITVDFSMATKSYDIFFSGCAAEERCKDCHNPEAWDFNCGKDWRYWVFKITEDSRQFGGMFDKFFILGGEPLDQDRDQFVLFLNFLQNLGKEIWLFTRFEMDEIPAELKGRFDYIKTGRYLPELSTTTNIQYGVRLATSNQEIWKRGVDFK